MKMELTPVPQPGSGRQGSLFNITVAEITEILGFAPNCDDDATKVVNSWGFRDDVGGHYYGVWDYKGSHEHNEFSVSGEPRVLTALFGDRYENYR